MISHHIFKIDLFYSFMNHRIIVVCCVQVSNSSLFYQVQVSLKKIYYIIIIRKLKSLLIDLLVFYIYSTCISYDSHDIDDCVLVVFPFNCSLLDQVQLSLKLFHVRNDILQKIKD